MKKEMYFDRTQSEMIRELVAAGVRTCKAESDMGSTKGKNV